MFPGLPLVALDFASPGMFWWLGAAAAPVLIHLLSRRRFRQTPWAAMDYLLAALRESRRRLRLEQFLLLVLRTLVVVLVVTAVAEPAIEGLDLAASQRQKTHRLLVLDASYSMAYQPAQSSRFEQARQIAAQIVQRAPEGDGFSLVLMGDQPQALVDAPAFDSADFLQQIERLEIAHGGADLARTLAAVEHVLETARQQARRLQRHEVYFLTDLHRATWGLERLDKKSVADLHERSRRLAQRALLVVLDLGQPEADNVAVTALQASDPLVRPGMPVKVEAKLMQYGRQGRSGQPVELRVNGLVVQHKQVALPAGQECAIQFSCRFESPGDHVLEVRAPGDRLSIDNSRFLVVPVREAIRVLCVDGRPAGDPSAGAAGYLLAALSSRPQGETGIVIRPDLVPESAFAESKLSEYDCVIFSNVPRFSRHEARLVERYLTLGGNLIFFLGDQVRGDDYNRELGGQTPGSIRILPAQIGPVVNQPENRLDPLDYRHPIVQAYRDHEGAGLLTTPIYRHFRLIVPKDSQARVALALAGGDPLIVEEPIARGRVVLVATSAERWWQTADTPFPLWPSFLPIVHETLLYAVGGQFRGRNLLVGEPLVGRWVASEPAASLSILRPGGKSDLAAAAPGSDASTWTYAQTDRSGFYVAQFGSPPFRREAFAVNLNTAESDLSPISPKELAERVWPDIPFRYQTAWQKAEEPSAPELPEHARLSRWLLYAALLLLVAETCLARRFGHYSP